MNLSVFLVLPDNYGEATVLLVETLNRYCIIKHYYESSFDPKVSQQPDKLLQYKQPWGRAQSIGTYVVYPTLYIPLLCISERAVMREGAPSLNVRRFDKI